MTEENNEKNDLMIGGVGNFDNKTKRQTTLDLSTKDNQIKMYNATQKCDIRLIDIKEQTINMVDLFVEEKEIAEKDKNDELVYNEKTGEVKMKKHYRTIIFDEEGKTYVSSAYGIYNSIGNITSIFGLPSKENMIKVRVTTRSLDKGRESLILVVEE